MLILSSPLYKLKHEQTHARHRIAAEVLGRNLVTAVYWSKRRGYYRTAGILSPISYGHIPHRHLLSLPSSADRFECRAFAAVVVYTVRVRRVNFVRFRFSPAHPRLATARWFDCTFTSGRS